MRLTGALKSKEVDETRGVFVHVLAGFTWRVAGSTLQLQGESSLVLFWICETAAALKSKEVDETRGVSPLGSGCIGKANSARCHGTFLPSPSDEVGAVGSGQWCESSSVLFWICETELCL